VNLNTASAEELERLPGIGPTRAQAILALRATLKQFSRPEQLLRVKGIGRATFRKLRPLLTLTGPTTLSTRARAPAPAPAK
jgi:competence protein ComEA